MPMDEAQAKAVDQAIELDLGEEDDISDIQVYLISEELHGGSAEEIIDIIKSNEDIEEPDAFNALMALAQTVDIKAGEKNATLEHVLVEFIWDIGGGDDNAFAQSMTVNKNESGLNAKFFDALGDYLDLGVAYDFSVITQDGYDDMKNTMEDALSSTIEMIEDIFEKVPGRIQSILDSLKLEKQTPMIATVQKNPRL